MAMNNGAAKRPQGSRKRVPGTPSKADMKRENKKLINKGAKYVLVAIGVAAMVLSVTAMACSGILNQMQSSEDYHLTGGVAATVNGVNITEDTITKQIMSTRSALGYDSDEDWAQYLVDNGITPGEYRESVIDSYARQYLISQAVSDYNVTVSDEEVAEAWNEAMTGYDSEDAFIDQLSVMGYTEDTYKESLRSSLQQEKLREEVARVDDPTDDEIVAYANEHLDEYNDARRSSHILFKVDSDADDATKEEVRAEAQSVLDKINAGEISFEDAAKEYSEDSSADNGGDVGWDKLTTFVSDYQDALSALDVDQVSGIVESSYGFHIITCTGHFYVDGSVTSIDQIPEDLRNQFSDTLKTEEEGTAYNDWLNSYVDEADIQINEMPADVPYNVSLEGVTPTSETEEGASDDETAQGEATE